MSRIIVALLCAATCAAAAAAPGLAQTQPSQTPNGTYGPAPMATGPSTTMEGVIAGVQLTGCALTPEAQEANGTLQGCWALLRVASAPASVHQTKKGEIVTSIDPVTVYVTPEASITTPGGTPVPVTALRKGDEVTVTYQQAHFGNVATTMTFRGRLGNGGGYGY